MKISVPASTNKRFSVPNILNNYDSCDSPLPSSQSQADIETQNLIKARKTKRRVVNSDDSDTTQSRKSYENNTASNSFSPQNNPKKEEKHRRRINLLNYTLCEVLGHGGQSVVVKAHDNLTNTYVAVKRINLTALDEEKLANIETEIRLLRNLESRYIIKYIDTIRSNNHLNIVMEYACHGSLTDIVKKKGKLPELVIAGYIKQVLKGLLYLHEEGVIHRDIKGGNILVTDDGTIRLADFGVATRNLKQDGDQKNEEMDNVQDVVGTPYWMAPEVIEMKPDQTSALDIWSVGATCVELLTGSPPYFEMEAMPALFRIVQDDEVPLPPDISPECTDFLRTCFQKNPHERPSAEKLLKHPWLNQDSKYITEKMNSEDPLHSLKQNQQDPLRDISESFQDLPDIATSLDIIVVYENRFDFAKKIFYLSTSIISIPSIIVLLLFWFEKLPYFAFSSSFSLFFLIISLIHLSYVIGITDDSYSSLYYYRITFFIEFVLSLIGLTFLIICVCFSNFNLVDRIIAIFYCFFISLNSLQIIYICTLFRSLYQSRYRDKPDSQPNQNRIQSIPMDHLNNKINHFDSFHQYINNMQSTDTGCSTLKTIFLIIFFLIYLVFIIFLIIETFNDVSFHYSIFNLSPTSTFYSINNKNLHLYCLGPSPSDSIPSIIFETPIGSHYLYYFPLLSLLSLSYHTCVYDRSGIGYSSMEYHRYSNDFLSSKVSDFQGIISQSGIDQYPYSIITHGYSSIISLSYALSLPSNTTLSNIYLIDYTLLSSHSISSWTVSSFFDFLWRTSCLGWVRPFVTLSSLPPSDDSLLSLSDGFTISSIPDKIQTEHKLISFQSDNLYSYYQEAIFHSSYLNNYPSLSSLSSQLHPSISLHTIDSSPSPFLSNNEFQLNFNNTAPYYYNITSVLYQNQQIIGYSHHVSLFNYPLYQSTFFDSNPKKLLFDSQTVSHINNIIHNTFTI